MNFGDVCRSGIQLDPPEPVKRFFGRYHDFEKVRAPDIDIRAHFDPQVKV